MVPCGSCYIYGTWRSKEVGSGVFYGTKFTSLDTMRNQYLIKNTLIVLNILPEMSFVSLFSILFGIHLLVLNILFKMNSLKSSKDLNR